MILYKYRTILKEGGDLFLRQMVRITSLRKTLNTLESTTEQLFKEGVKYRTQEENQAFLHGFKTALNLIRKEYEIEPDDS